MFGNDMFRDEISPEQNRINQDLFENLQVHLESEVSFLPLFVSGARDCPCGNHRFHSITGIVRKPVGESEVSFSPPIFSGA